MQVEVAADSLSPGNPGSVQESNWSTPKARLHGMIPRRPPTTPGRRQGTLGAGLRDHDRVADLIVAHRSIDRSAISENFIL